MTDSPMNQEARTVAARRYPPDDRGRTETYPLDALRAAGAAAFASGAQWQRDRLRGDDVVESAARAVYDQTYRSMTGYSWTAATETVRNEYRATAIVALTAAVEAGEVQEP